MLRARIYDLPQSRRARFKHYVTDAVYRKMEIMTGRVILSEKGAFHSRIHRYLALLLWHQTFTYREMFICTFGLLYTHTDHHIFVHMTHKHTFHIALH